MLALVTAFSPNSEIEMWSTRVPRVSSDVAPELLTRPLPGSGECLWPEFFGATPENHTPQAYAPGSPRHRVCEIKKRNAPDHSGAFDFFRSDYFCVAGGGAGVGVALPLPCRSMTTRALT
jgi:hypothetical protein